jgi:hypothetical protein
VNGCADRFDRDLRKPPTLCRQAVSFYFSERYGMVALRIEHDKGKTHITRAISESPCSSGERVNESEIGNYSSTVVCSDRNGVEVEVEQWV